ncbi:hypothetical protein SAMN02745146_0873 [Hymenobacter daecheongensis DSM 21074]|uniref:Uncharacterized protein n=1 Tax=Hymenobacter daecheongensis DSM 21074 TaxID=1121955 RepID=A0A1M6B4I9_9BACT|nr:hypothetical protein SAMN02745146_0873 [Hymenobacter daecheongensis DSM 21074]
MLSLLFSLNQQTQYCSPLYITALILPHKFDYKVMYSVVCLLGYEIT